MKRNTLIGIWIMVVLLMNIAFFMQGTLTGQSIVTARMFVLSQQHLSTNFTFVEGWNLISYPASLDNSSVNSVLSSLGSNYTSLHYYDSLDKSDLWEAHHKNLTSSAIQDLENLSSKKGYWIYMVNESILQNSGTINAVETIQVYAGWNLIGYPSNVTRTITAAFSSINGSYSSIYTYYANDTLDPWKVYNPSIAAEFSDLTHAVPFYGYWVNASANASILLIS